MSRREEEVAHIPSVKDLIVSNGTYHFTMSGSMDALIAMLSHHKVVRFFAEEAPLEEVFLKFYEEQK